MAKVIYSAMVGDARGKVGGNVMTKGRFGAVDRAKVSPVQPRTSYQRAVRAGFTDASKAWSALTDQNTREAWESFARSNPVKDVFGATRILTGHQMFVRLNRVVVRLGGTQIDLPPLALSISEPISVALTATAGPAGTLVATVTGPPAAGEAVEFWAARPQNAGRKFVGSNYRLMDVDPVLGDPGPYNLGSMYEWRFGTLISGQTIRVLIKYGNPTTGAQGMGVEGKCVVT